MAKCCSTAASTSRHLTTYAFASLSLLAVTVTVTATVVVQSPGSLDPIRAPKLLRRMAGRSEIPLASHSALRVSPTAMGKSRPRSRRAT